jgi:hypothetical protein
MPRLTPLVWLGIAASAAMAIGAFGPWIKAVGLANVTVSGTDGGNDGWLVLVAAIFGASAFAVYHGGHRLPALVACLAGVCSAFVTIHDRRNLSTAIEGDTGGLVAVDVGWGLNLAMVSSLALAAVGLTAFIWWETQPPPHPEERTATRSQTRATRPAETKSSTVEEIERLAELRTRGMLTDDEFSRAKERLLEQPPT